MTMNEATRAQIAATNPRDSIWLSANAGSGKTRVLTDRVARLLLGGVPPQRILCLTYTKAAASEMQNRLFDRLGAWAMMSDAELLGELERLGVEASFDRANLRQARTLFARAIETPGGLKIQTIHSFCGALLRRFPLEAGISPQFQEIDTRASELLQAEVLDDMVTGPSAEVFHALTTQHSGHEIERLVRGILGNAAQFSTVRAQDDIWDWYGLPAGFDEARLVSEAFHDGDRAVLGACKDLFLAHGSANDVKLGQLLNELPDGPFTARHLEMLEGGFLTKSGQNPFTAKTDKIPTKATRALVDETLLASLHDMMERIEAARSPRLGLLGAQRTLVLNRFAHAFISAYEARKAERGWLDFDDLINKASELLTERKMAAWVLFRLDGGIDHILVDEAQDTSPAQWRVIRQLSWEFTAGEGARADTERSIFVVGDPKQSIYSFQGADPQAFDDMAQTFEGEFAALEASFQRRTLEFSFRSSPVLLDLVDQTFHSTDHRGLGMRSHHRAFFDGLAGRVDLWPTIEQAEKETPPSLTDTLDRVTEENQNVRLARTIAEEIERLIKTGSIPDKTTGKPRPIRPGDFVILVRRRSDLFEHIIRSCKARNLPIAGADRLKLGSEIAVKDIQALLSFLSTDADDLSLATVLRSPLLGWSEDDLFGLAHGRGDRVLWQVLRENGDAFPETMSLLNDMRDMADFLRPYDLIERLLSRHDGRRKLLGRLGPEAEDGIDTLLSQALAYERNDVPSLTGFLNWMETDDVEVKRTMDAVGDQIRVMTVHGAKGLESPIVIMPDTAAKTDPNKDNILVIDDERAIWKPKAEEMVPFASEAANKLKEANEDERRRLLYVGMTRAEQWLIVCAAGDVKDGEESWHAIVEQGMRAAGASPIDTPAGEGLRLCRGDWADGALHSHVAEAPDEPKPTLPEWVNLQASRPPKGARILSPSLDLGGAKVIGAEASGHSEDAALRRGRMIHRLLEHLPSAPKESWDRFASELLSFGDDIATPDELNELLHSARAVLEAPSVAHVFLPGTLAEVDIAAPIPGTPNRIVGTIDRLIITPQSVTIVDFKTNQIVPDRPEDIPEGLLRQMGAYAMAMAQIYPDRQIETAILWTQTATLMPIPHDMVRDAFAAAPTS